MQKQQIYRLALPLAGLATLSFGALAQDFQPRVGEPVNGLNAAQLQRFADGTVEFNNVLTISDGLGPIFNDVSCGTCHSFPAAGGAGTKTVIRAGIASNGGNPFDPLASLGGSLFQKDSIDPLLSEVVPASADVIALRVTPQAIGIGLLEAIDDADILAYAASPQIDPSLTGYVRMTQPFEGGPMRASKMGWKGGVATALSFSADASLNEMGLTNRFVSTENAPNGDLVALAFWDSVPDPEDFPDPVTGLERIDRMADFQVLSAAPAQTPKSGMIGETVFENIGCAACHVNTPYITGPHTEAVLSGVSIKPYSDFLVHDMGSLGDGIADGPVGEFEMMTRTLWGFAMRQSALHDGRYDAGSMTFADMVDLAIKDHDGEAAFSRTNYLALSLAQKDQLTAFLGSLGRAEGDWDYNNRIDQFDWFFLQPSVTGPDAGTVTPDSAGALIDIDQDGDVDMADMAIFQRAYTN